MSATKIGKIIAEQSKLLLNQRDKIKKIYNPNNLGIRSSSNNIRASNEFPLINNKNVEKAINSSFNGEHFGQRTNNFGDKLSYSSSKEGKKRDSRTNLIYSDSKNINSEALNTNDSNIRKQLGVSEMIRTNWNEANSLSILGNISGVDLRAIEKAAKENATMSIKAKKQKYYQHYEQSLSNKMKYETTVAMSEKYPNLEGQHPQMYTYSILSACKPDRNIEEIHYIQVNLLKGVRKILEKTEFKNTENNLESSPELQKIKASKIEESKSNIDGNLMEIWNEEILI